MEHESLARLSRTNIWSPLYGGVLKCKREPTNKENEYAIAIMRTDSMGDGDSIVEHIPKNISKVMFLTLPRSLNQLRSRSF